MTASRILVVDDEADIRGLLKEILSEEGYDVEIAADASQARVLARRAGSRSRAAGHLDAGHGWHHAAARMVGDRRLRLPGGHDVGPRHRRDRGRGDAPRRIRFRGEAAVADQAAAHRGARARCRAPQAACRRARKAPRWRCPSASPRSRKCCANRYSRRPRAHRRCCWSANWDRDARPMRATCTP